MYHSGNDTESYLYWEQVCKGSVDEQTADLSDCLPNVVQQIYWFKTGKSD